jgi:death on curing protein
VINPVWLDPRFPLKAHQLLVERYGGNPGIRDHDSLEAAMARPQQILAYSEDTKLTIFTLAAALGWSICRRHPFVDGNKRIAFACVTVFLLINGYQLDVSNHEATQVMVDVASSTITEEHFATWLADNSYHKE